jgi:hypothetical protein
MTSTAFLPYSPSDGGFTATEDDTDGTGSASRVATYTRTYNGRIYTCADFTIP